MKVIKHCHQDANSPADDAQGVLLGLIMENKLEVTNCFPFPRSIDGVDDGALFQQRLLIYPFALSLNMPFCIAFWPLLFFKYFRLNYVWNLELRPLLTRAPLGYPAERAVLG